MPGFQGFAVQTHAGMAVDNTEIAGVIDDVTIKPSELQDGLWDLAEVRFFQVNWADLTMGQLKLRKGWVGNISLHRTLYVAELRGLMQALVRELGDLFSPDCQADLGDARCKVDLVPLTVTGTVTSVTDRRIFIDTSRTEVNAWFEGGVITWTSGLNNQRHMEIEAYNGTTKQFSLFLAMSNSIQVGNTYSVYPGCDKRIATCIAKFNNVNNFRGYPYTPGLDNLLRYPDSHIPQ